MDLTRRDTLRLAALLGALVPLAGCDHRQPSVPPTVGPPHIDLARADLARSVGDPGRAAAAAAAVHAVGAGLYDGLAGQAGNLVFSPYSVAVTLAMTAHGAHGRTATEMLEVLGVDHLDGLDEGLAALTQHVEGLAGPVDTGAQRRAVIELAAANGLFAQAGIRWQPGFLEALARWYGAGVRLVDAEHDAATARRLVNQWASEQTHGRIPEIVPAGGLDALTRLVLVDALYLQAPWGEPFEPGQTGDRAWELDEVTTVGVPMMSLVSSSSAWGAGDGWQALRLLYAGGELAMTVVLPDRGRMADVAAQVAAGGLPRILGSVEHRPVQLTLPRWRFRSTTPLAEVLADLGMPTAFDAEAADFSRMTHDERLHVGAVWHQTFVAVDERGTEAAAATAVQLRTTAVPLPEQHVGVDRPFLFVIHDVEHSTPLFVGRVTDPRA